MPDYRQVADSFAEMFNIDKSIFRAQINQESGFDPNAVSSAGARGIAQIMPATARDWGVDPSDPVASLRAAAQHDAEYLASYQSWPKALVAYNAGPGYASQWNGTRSRLNSESRQYLDAILGPDWENGTVVPGGGSGATPPGISIDPSAWWAGIKEWWTGKVDAAEGGAVEVVAPWVVGAVGIVAISIGTTAMVLRSPPAKLVTQVAKSVPNPYIQGGAKLVGTVQ